MTTHGTPVRIFLVEDNPPDVVLIREALHAHNISHHILCCTDGEEAIRTLSNCENLLVPDLIILDLNLPRIGGFDVLRWVRTTPRLNDVPVAILTSSQASQDRELAESLGAAAFISKPPNLSDFLSNVGATLARLLSTGRPNLETRAGCHCSMRLRRCVYHAVAACAGPGSRQPRTRYSALTPGRPFSTTKLARVFTPAPGLVTNGTTR